MLVLQFHSNIRFVLLHNAKGVKQMTEIERELIDTIRESKNPEQAILTAAIIIGSFLELPLSYPRPFADSQRGHA